MTTELSGCDIYYTFDGTNPDRFMPKYTGDPVAISGEIGGRAILPAAGFQPALAA